MTEACGLLVNPIAVFDKSAIAIIKNVASILMHIAGLAEALKTCRISNDTNIMMPFSVLMEPE